jgi:hypothetical protein
MPNNAATAAARLSVAPMMDSRDSIAISILCLVACAARVHDSIGLFRAASCYWWLALQSTSMQGEARETASRRVAV